MWNKYKPSLGPKILLLVSAQETFYRKESRQSRQRETINIPRLINTGRWTAQDEVKKLTAGGFNFQWFHMHSNGD